MKVKLVKNKDLIREYNVVCDEEMVSSEYAKVLVQASKDVKIDGFEKGKAPAEMVEKRLGAKIMEVVATGVQRKILRKVFEDEKIVESVAHIENVVPMEPYTKNSMKISFRLQMHPEIPAIKYEKIKAEVLSTDVTDEFVEKKLDEIAKGYSSTKKIEEERALKLGDISIIDFVGRVDGELIEGGSANDYRLEIGSKSFIDTFEDQLIGMKISEQKTIKVRFPDQYQAPNLSGKNAEFDVVLKEIHESVLPEKNDDFAKIFGFESYKALFEKLKENINSENERQIKLATKALVDKAIREKYCDFQCPPIFIDPEYKRVLDLLTKRNESLDEKKRKKSEEIEKEAKKKSEENVCMSYVYRNIITENKFEPSEEQISAEISREAASSGMPFEELFAKYKQDESLMGYVISKIQEDKAFDSIFDKISKSTKKVEIEKLQEELEKIYKSIEQ